MATKDRYDWVDAAKGISIILVVMMYSAHNVGKYTDDIGILHYVIGFATPFRMPEFFLISGLFLSHVIARDWKRYTDRRVVHYFYFYAVWAAINIVLKVGIAGRDIPGMLSDLGLAIVEPYGVLWFIYMLGVFSVVAKLAWQFKLPHWLVLGAAALLQMAPIDVPSYAVTQFCAYFVFFYLGYVASPLVFRIVDAAAARPMLAVLGFAALGACGDLPGLLAEQRDASDGNGDGPGRLSAAASGSRGRRRRRHLCRSDAADEATLHGLAALARRTLARRLPRLHAFRCRRSASSP
jgi:uncharacterized membrane protein YcfT